MLLLSLSYCSCSPIISHILVMSLPIHNQSRIKHIYANTTRVSSFKPKIKLISKNGSITRVSGVKLEINF